jgi:hypothetical protein
MIVGLMIYDCGSLQVPVGGQKILGNMWIDNPTPDNPRHRLEF